MLPVCPSLVNRRPQGRGALPALLGLAIGCLLALPLQARAQVYASAPADDEAAPLVLSNFASEDTPRLVIDAPPAAPPLANLATTRPGAVELAELVDAGQPSPTRATSPAAFSRAPGVPDNLLPWFRHIGREQALPVSLLLAVAAAESGFNPRARSPKGAQGLMQLMPATARWTARKLGLDFKPEQITDRQINLRLGVGYLKLVLDDVEGSLPMAAAAYNAGPSRLRRWRDGPPLEVAAWAEGIPFTETRDYVKKVLSNASYYGALLGGAQAVALRSRLGPPIASRPPGAAPENKDLP